MVVSNACYQLYSRPFDERLLKKRIPKLTAASYNTVRLLDYLEEKQKLSCKSIYYFRRSKNGRQEPKEKIIDYEE